MPPDLTIGPTPPPVQPSPAHPSPTQASVRAAGPVASRGFAQAVAAPAAGTPAPPSAPPNRVVLDPASDRVVLEYFDSTGTLVNSLPSQRQLDAYRLAASAVAEPGSNIKKA